MGKENGKYLFTFIMLPSKQAFYFIFAWKTKIETDRAIAKEKEWKKSDGKRNENRTLKTASFLSNCSTFTIFPFYQSNALTNVWIFKLWRVFQKSRRRGHDEEQ